MVANLLLHAVIRGIHIGADTLLTQLGGNLFEVRGEFVSHRNAHHLVRCQPCWEGTGVVLQQDAKESLDGAEERTVNHDWALLSAVRRGVFQLEALRQVEVQLHGRHLPGTADGVARLHRNLRAVEGCTCGIRNQLQAGLFCNRLQDRRRAIPDLIRTDELIRVLGGKLQVEVRQSVVLQQGNDEVEDLGQLFFQLLFGAVNVGIVLGKAAGTGQAVDHARLFVTVDGTELK